MSNDYNINKPKEFDYIKTYSEYDDYEEHVIVL